MHQEGTLHQKWTSLVGPDWLRPFSERQHFASDLLMGPWWWFVSSWDPLWERNWTRLHQTETPGKLSPSLSPEGKTIKQRLFFRQEAKGKCRIIGQSLIPTVRLGISLFVCNVSAGVDFFWSNKNKKVSRALRQTAVWKYIDTVTLSEIV